MATLTATPTATPTRWNGAVSQEELMEKDTCVLVDPQDNILGSASKADAHIFDRKQPNGRLHRAFSVFLFDSHKRLLLQRRADSKITFPGVWTNTCCSHQLYGYDPTEVDTPADVEDGSVPGTKRAAIRKLGHELGIAPEQLPAQDFHYLTRLHYCAPDSHTYGPDAPWGEHEVDYILFIKADVDLQINPEEISDVAYVTPEQLEEMMMPESGLRWSPWFRIIATNFLKTWWQDLDAVLTSKKHADYTSVHSILECAPACQASLP